MESPDVDAIIQLLVIPVQSPAADAGAAHAFYPILDIAMRVIAIVGDGFARLVNRYQHYLGLGKAVHGSVNVGRDFVFVGGKPEASDVEGRGVHFSKTLGRF